MSKTLYIKLIKASPKAGPFNISDQRGNIIINDVPRSTLINGLSYTVNDSVTMLVIESVGNCSLKRTFDITTIQQSTFTNTPFIDSRTACLWRHLTNISLYNNFYGNIEPYIIEYPFAYQFQDQILQNVKDYTKAYKYITDGTGVFSYNDKIEINAFFNKAIVYNGQQSSGILELVPKPVNNLQEYMKYPILQASSKKIIYTKSDNFYQYNTFWNIVKDKTIPLFLTSCNSLSIDKEVNQENMCYTDLSFRKSTIRAKDLKIRHQLDNSSDVHLVSQFILVPSQISYK